MPNAEPNADWGPLRFLVGEWTGEGGGEPGEGTGGFSFLPDLGGKVLIRKNRAEYPATPERPAYAHDDLMIVYREPSGDALRAIYFDSEAHVIRYAVEADDAGGVRFVSDEASPGPRFRLSYAPAGADAVALRFEIAPPGGAGFATYIEATARRR